MLTNVWKNHQLFPLITIHSESQNTYYYEEPSVLEHYRYLQYMYKSFTNVCLTLTIRVQQNKMSDYFFQKYIKLICWTLFTSVTFVFRQTTFESSRSEWIIVSCDKSLHFHTITLLTVLRIHFTDAVLKLGLCTHCNRTLSCVTYLSFYLFVKLKFFWVYFRVVIYLFLLHQNVFLQLFFL